MLRPDRYTESPVASRPFRIKQYEQLDRLTKSMLDDAVYIRRAWFNPDVGDINSYLQSISHYRNELASIIGYPPSICYRHEMPIVVDIGEDSSLLYKRVMIPIAEGLDCYGLLLVPKCHKRQKLMVCLHGGGGCPEAVCGVVDTANYHEAGRRFADIGYTVFAPLISFTAFVDADVDDDLNCCSIPSGGRMMLDIRSKWVGTSLLAIELWKISQSITTLCLVSGLNVDDVSVAGLSYGGMYSLLLAALDVRIKLCISSCMFNDRINVMRESLLWPDMVWFGSARKFTDVEMAALVCPRKLWVEVGEYDERLPAVSAEKAANEAMMWYGAIGQHDGFVFHRFDGGHEFCLDAFIARLCN